MESRKSRNPDYDSSPLVVIERYVSRLQYPDRFSDRLGVCTFITTDHRRHRNKIATLHHENERKLFDAKIGFFTHITHEIRTPVTLILAPVEEIMRQKNIPEEIRDDLEVVKRNSERLLDLVNQILDFTKAEQEAFSSQNTWFDIDDLVE